MAFEIHTSQFWNGADQNAFDNAVKNYIDTLHSFNMIVGKPRPTAHPLVERPVKRVQTQGQPDKYVADYVVVDDRPPPPSLVHTKNNLSSEVRFPHNTSMHKILPT